MNLIIRYMQMVLSVVFLWSCSSDFVSVIPKPAKVKSGSGEFVLNENTNVIIENGNEDVTKTVGYLIEKLTESTGLKLSLAKNNVENSKIH